MKIRTSIFLAKIFKKFLYRFLAGFFHDAGINDRNVIETVFAEEIDDGSAGPALRIEGTEIDGLYAGVEYGAGTHGTGFERHIKLTPVKTPGTCGPAGLLYGKELGVRRGLPVGLP